MIRPSEEREPSVPVARGAELEALVFHWRSDARKLLASEKTDTETFIQASRVMQLAGLWGRASGLVDSVRHMIRQVVESYEEEDKPEVEMRQIGFGWIRELLLEREVEESEAEHEAFVKNLATRCPGCGLQQGAFSHEGGCHFLCIRCDAAEVDALCRSVDLPET